MTRGDLRRFLSGIERSIHPLARRDHALFSTLAYTGVRLSEITRAVWGDLDLRHRLLLLRSVKGGGAETRHVPRRLLQILADYSLRVKDRVRANLSPMFASSGYRPLSPRGVQYRFGFWLTRSGIRRRMSVHSLRHTFATLLYRATGDLLLVSRALGHRDIRTTHRYAYIEDRLLVGAVNRL